MNIKGLLQPPFKDKQHMVNVVALHARTIIFSETLLILLYRGINYAKGSNHETIDNDRKN